MFLLPMKLKMLFGSSQMMLENMIIRFYTNLWRPCRWSVTVNKAKEGQIEDILKFILIIFFFFISSIFLPDSCYMYLYSTTHKGHYSLGKWMERHRDQTFFPFH